MDKTFKVSIYILLISVIAVMLNILNPNIERFKLGSILMLVWLLFALTAWILFWILGDCTKRYWSLNYAISSFISAFFVNLFIANYLVGYDSNFLSDFLKYNESTKSSVYDYFGGYLFALSFCSALGFLPPFCFLHIVFITIIHFFIKQFK